MMTIGVDLHTVEEAEIVGVLREFRERLRNHETALARGTELQLRERG